VLTNTFFENKVDQLNEVTDRLAAMMQRAGIPYQIIGGFAIFAHIDAVDPLLARLTRDVDIAVERRFLRQLAEAAQSAGFAYRHVAGVDMLVDAKNPKARSAVHMVFAGEKVRAEYVEPVPPITSPVPTPRGFMIAPVADLVRMKLTSFRLKDKVHVKDMDAAKLITSEIEASLSPVLRERLREVRTQD
jgi:hypothetical protein